ncbi:MAG: hypothetical protein ACPGGD_03485 [Thalassolituus sp.]|jgi:hypothetical protein
MFHGFSRRTLNVIIIGCLLVITGIQFGFKDNEDTPLEPIAAAPLSDTGWHQWQSNEDVPVSWQTFGTKELHIVIQREALPPIKLNLMLSRWATELSQAFNEISEAATAIPGAIALQGATDPTTMQQAAAYVIRQLQLTPPNHQEHKCQLDHLAGAYWWNQQDGRSLALPATAEITSTETPSRDEWQNFRTHALRDLREKWLSPSAAIDIQAELAYHRWPNTYFYDLYQDLSQAQRTAPMTFADCLTR